MKRRNGPTISLWNLPGAIGGAASPIDAEDIAGELAGHRRFYFTRGAMISPRAHALKEEARQHVTRECRIEPRCRSICGFATRVR